MREPIAWLVETAPAGAYDRILIDAETAAWFSESPSYRVTPLVAAPPARAIAEVRELLREYGACICAYETAGRDDAAVLDVEVPVLEERILAYVSCAAPPERAVAEAERMLSRLAVLAEMGTVGAWREVDELRTRLVSMVACAAPPEGAPTYAQLRDGLFRLARPYGFGCSSPEDSPACGLCSGCEANALLSRIPNEE